MSARSSGAMRGHGPLSKASRAAATALSMSAVVPSGTRPTFSSVDGEITSITPVPGRCDPVATDVQTILDRHARSPH